MTEDANPLPPLPESAPQAGGQTVPESAPGTGFGASLQVERMPESDELQERRSRTKGGVEEMTANAELDPAQVLPASEPFDEDGGGFMEMLREANLSPRHFRFCCGGIVILGLLAGIIFGGVQFVRFLANRPDDEPDLDEPESITEIEVVVPDGLDPSIKVGLISGSQPVFNDISTDVGEASGELDLSDDELASVIDELSELFEAVQVDVIHLLDASNTRSETLNGYLETLRFLQYQSTQNLEDLLAQNTLLEAQFLLREEEKNLFEGRFFDEMRDLDAFASVAALDRFIVLQQELADLEAQFKARLKLIEYHELILDATAIRIKDIELNEEALVKGVQVVDIQGSDIDLILDENEL